MYVIIMARSSNRHSGKEIVRSLCKVELTCHCQKYKNVYCCTTILLWQISVASRNKTCLGLHVNCAIVLSSFKQIWTFSTGFPTRPQHFNFTAVRPVGAALMHAERRSGGWTDRHDEANIGAFGDCAHAPGKWKQKVVPKHVMNTQGRQPCPSTTQYKSQSNPPEIETGLPQYSIERLRQETAWEM
jgi:hypothetical protein